MTDDTTETPDAPGLSAFEASQTEGLTAGDVRQLLGLITEDELGRALNVVGATVALWRGQKQGPPFYKFKRQIFYRTADVTQWLIENTWDPVTGKLLLGAGEKLSPLASPPPDQVGGQPRLPPPPAAGVAVGNSGPAVEYTPAGTGEHIVSAAERLRQLRAAEG